MNRYILKAKIFLLLPFIFTLSYGTNYREIIHSITSTPAIKSAKLMEEASKELYKATQGALYPTLDIELKGIWLQDKPIMFSHSNGAVIPLPAGTKRKYEGSLTIRYPLFTGFAIEAKIAQAKWQKEIAKLKILDLQRNLLLKISELYSAIEAEKDILLAKREAKKALLDALTKANKMYQNGLISPAELYNIKAKSYDIDASIAQTNKQISQMLNSLSYLSGKKIRNISRTLNPTHLPKITKLIHQAYHYRSDLRSLQSQLKISQAQIDLAKSNLYPHIGVEASLKRQGDTLRLNGDGFSNANHSYVGVDVSWNLFNGGRDLHKIQASKFQHLATASRIIDYRRYIANELKNAKLDLDTLYIQLKSTKMKLKAQREYYRLTRGRFDNKLSSADELSRSIANLAQAKAQVATIKAQIKAQKIKLWLLSGVENFKRHLRF